VSVEIGGVVGKSLNLERFDGQGLHLIPDVPDREGGSGEVHEVGKVSGLGPIRTWAGPRAALMREERLSSTAK